MLRVIEEYEFWKKKVRERMAELTIIGFSSAAVAG